MRTALKLMKLFLVLMIMGSCSAQDQNPSGANIKLAEPFHTKSAVKFPRTAKWPADMKPQVLPGFDIDLFHEGLDNPRWIHVLENGDVIVAETGRKFFANSLGKTKNQITLLRDVNGDGVIDSETLFAEDFTGPFGMAHTASHFYIADTYGVYSYEYTLGQDVLGERTQIADLPGGGYHGHWTRNLQLSHDQKHLFITVGSGSNVAEDEGDMALEDRRASVLRIDLNGQNEVLFCSGIRNPVGMDIEPQTGDLWTVVNERDGLGDDLVPDYLTRVNQGDFYGWPWVYWGEYPDPRHENVSAELIEKTSVPTYALKAHSASLGLCFYEGEMLPKEFQGAAIIGQHGSWNRSKLSGYKVVYVPFTDGEPSGEMQDLVWGFIENDDAGKCYGRPVGVQEWTDGSLLIADDDGDCIWRLSFSEK